MRGCLYQSPQIGPIHDANVVEITEAWLIVVNAFERAIKLLREEVLRHEQLGRRFELPNELSIDSLY